MNTNYRILVVDDEEDLCDILKFNLENEGYEVETANSAEEALKMDLTKFHLLLLDVMMGEISGFKMAKMLKQVRETRDIPIIFLTARDTENDAVTGFTLGADDYISKPFSLREVQALADVTHDARDIAASISSGSFQTLGMVILPCSIKTLSGIVHSYTDGLLTRAADVVLKERRPLVLCVRETPLHLGHLRLMTQAAEIGAVIMPPVPAFYHRPQSLDDVINQTVNRVLDQFAVTLPEDLFARWQGA